MDVRYPKVRVRLSGEDGNAFFIVGRVRAALRKAGVDADTVEQFTNEATSGDYDHVIQTAMKWVDVS